MRTKFYDGDGATKAEAEIEAGGGRVTSMVGYHGTLVAQAIATSKKKSNGSAKVCHAGSPSPTAISLKETGNFLAAQQWHKLFEGGDTARVCQQTWQLNNILMFQML